MLIPQLSDVVLHLFYAVLDKIKFLHQTLLSCEVFLVEFVYSQVLHDSYEFFCHILLQRALLLDGFGLCDVDSDFRLAQVVVYDLVIEESGLLQRELFGDIKFVLRSVLLLLRF